MRIVLCGDGTRGDLQPLIELARQARAIGHDALVCGPPDFVDLARDAAVPYVPVGTSAQAFFTEHADILKRRNPVSLVREAMGYVREQLSQKVAALLDVGAGADWILAGGAELGASSAAERLGVAYRFVCYCPVLLPSREHAPVFANVDTQHPWLNRALWPLVMWPIAIGVGRLLGPVREAIGLERSRTPFLHMMGERPILAADRLLATVPRDTRLAPEQIPGLHPLGGEPLPAKLESFLEAGPPPVYVGFGSMPDADPGRTTRIVLDVAERLGVRVVLSSGWARLGGVPLPGSVLEVGPVAHPLLFPRCAAIVHHGGAGTTTTALRAGTPQVVVPHLADQFYWGRRVQELGLGVATRRKHRIGVADLLGALSSVLDNEFVAERAAQIGAQARTEAADRTRLERLFSR